MATHHGGTVAGLATGGAMVFAATAVGVYRSTDSGRSWTLPGIGPSVPFASAVAVSPRFAQDQTVFACGADRLYRSSDGGDSWHEVLVGSRMLSVVTSQAETQESLLVLAGTAADGILRSEDGGRTWAGANAGLLDLTAICLAVSPCFEADRTGFAGTASGLYRTRSGGRSWRSVDTGVEEPAVQCLAVSPSFADDGLILAGTEVDGLLRSVDGGTTWHRPASLANGGIAAVAFSPRYPAVNTIAAATESGIAVSHDGGETWELSGAALGLAMSLAFIGDELLAGLHQHGIVRSVDGGASWQQASHGLSARLDTELVLSPDFARDRTLFVGGLEDGVRVSTDGGVTWEDRSAGLEESGVFGLAVSVSYAVDRTLFAATSAGVRISHDGGRTWLQAPTPEGLAKAVATGPDIVVAAIEGSRLRASEDGGRTWRTLPVQFGEADVIALAVSPAYARDRTLFVATAGAGEVVLWRSVDGGLRWERWLVEAGGGQSRMPLAVSPNHAIDECVFVGLGGRVLRPLRHAREVRSGERRPIWRSCQLGAQEPVGITGLVVSPAFGEDHTLFAATNAGVFVARDGGETFQLWNDGLFPPRTVAVTVSPAYRSDRLVYALGLGGTVWRRRDD